MEPVYLPQYLLNLGTGRLLTEEDHKAGIEILRRLIESLMFDGDSIFRTFELELTYFGSG